MALGRRSGIVADDDGGRGRALATHVFDRMGGNSLSLCHAKRRPRKPTLAAAQSSTRRGQGNCPGDWKYSKEGKYTDWRYTFSSIWLGWNERKEKFLRLSLWNMLTYHIRPSPSHKKSNCQFLPHLLPGILLQPNILPIPGHSLRQVRLLPTVSQQIHASHFNCQFYQYVTFGAIFRWDRSKSAHLGHMYHSIYSDGSAAILSIISNQIDSFGWKEAVVIMAFLFASPASSSANLIASEIFPTSSRTILLCVMFINSMLGGMAGVWVDNYLISAALMIFAAIIAFLFCPDAERKTLEEI